MIDQQAWDRAKDQATDLLAKVEADLREADRCDDEIGRHAADAEAMTAKEIARLRPVLGEAGNDEDVERRYLWLLGQRRRAQIVQAMAKKLLKARRQ